MRPAIGSSACSPAACTRCPRRAGRRSPGRRSDQTGPTAADSPSATSVPATTSGDESRTGSLGRLAAMDAWPAPQVPALPGAGLPLRLHDTATGSTRTIDVGAEARLYVCGITPYDATHLGHAATYVAFDLVQRAW